VAVGLAHNTVHIYNFPELPGELRLDSVITCGTRCITYSMEFLGSSLSSLMIASGTVENEILMWPVSQSTPQPETVHRLKGHEGVIFKVSFNKGGTLVASTSDDRTVRLWSHSSHSTSSPQTPSIPNLLSPNSTYTLLWTGWSHTSRVWDVTFTSSNTSLVSSGEDGTAKVWDVEEGKVKAELKGHGAKSIWRVAVAEGDGNNDIAVTGGNDGCAKIYNLDYHRVFNDPDGEFGGFDVKLELPEKRQPLESKKKKSKFVIHSLFNLPSHPSTTVAITTSGDAFVTSSKKNPPTLTQLSLPDDPPSISNLTTTSSSVHPRKPIVAFGFSSGLIKVISLTSSPPSTNNIPPNSDLHGVLHLAFIATLHNDCTLLSGHIKGIVQQLDYKKGTLIRTFDLSSSKILSASLYVQGVGLFLGENRGTLSFYDLTTVPVSPSKPAPPTSQLPHLHPDSHLTKIAYDPKQRLIYTIGHNSTLTTSTLTSSLSLSHNFNTNVPFAPALTHLYLLPSSDIIVGGFQSNNFILYNMTQSYQLMRFNCGGWRQSHDFRFNFLSPTSFTTQLSTASNNNGGKPATIQIYGSPSTPLTPASSYKSYNLNTPYHGSTVHGVSMFSCNGQILAISGSEDCTLKLTCYDEVTSRMSVIQELERFECSVRAVCSSVSPQGISGRETALVVAVGGKLEIAAYRVSKEGVMLVHKNTDSGTKEMDHRMNSVASIHVDEGIHLVVTGDSRGRIQVIQIDVNKPKIKPQILSDHLEGLTSRPILSLSIISVANDCSKFIVAVGNTAGEIGIFHLTVLKTVLSSILLHKYKPHQMGANDVTCKIERDTLTVVSGGDDQALSVFQFGLKSTSSPPSLSPLSSYTLANAATSAIKATLIDDASTIYTVGYDQRLASWKYTSTSEPAITALSDPLLLSVTDVSSASVVPSLRSPNLNVITVTGDGAEIIAVPSSREQVIEIDPRSIKSAAKLLFSASHVLLTTGAGMGKDSGLQTFEEMSENYKDLCDPSALCKAPDKFQDFWETFSKQYKDADLHDGYKVIQRLLGGEEAMLPKLESSYCYTSNVDGLIRRLPCFSDGDRICEIHGFAGEWRCSGAMGKTLGGENRMGEMWENWNKKVEESGYSPFICMLAKEVVGEKFCSCCSLYNRPNVLMFNDTDSSVIRDVDKAREKYQMWEGKVEDDVVESTGASPKSLVILELGCGVHVPSVRNEGYEVLRDVRQRGGKAHLIRVNLKDEGHVEGKDLDVEESVIEKGLVSVKGGGKDVMVLIEAEIERLLVEGEESEEEDRDLVFDNTWFDNQAEEVLQEFGNYGVDEDGPADGVGEDEESKRMEEERVFNLTKADITAVVTPKGVMKITEDEEMTGKDEKGASYENSGRELQFDDGWDKAKDDEVEIIQERQLVMDDSWGENEEEEIGRAQVFGEYGEDEDVKQKHLKEEEDKELEERRKKEQEERARLEEEDRKKEEEEGIRELVFDDF